MNETVISWTPQNWITVFLMVFLGTVMAGAAMALFSRVRGKASE